MRSGLEKGIPRPDPYNRGGFSKDARKKKKDKTKKIIPIKQPNKTTTPTGTYCVYQTRRGSNITDREFRPDALVPALI